MTQIRILTALCAGILLWTTCTTESTKSDLLSDALHAVDDNPQEALALLENISPESYDYDKDQHMQFVVILTQARYMDYQDTTGDSLILDAQRYFARGRNYEMATRASYYAAMYWYEEESNEKAVEYWQATLQFAEQADNDLFMAKSVYWLARSYFIQEQWEEALPYCQKALILYDVQPVLKHYKLDIVNMLGLIHQKLQDLEQAYRYFDEGLKAAKELNNTMFESRFLKNKGIIHRDKGEYQQAKEYFDLALSKQPETEEMTRIYLSYAILYRAMNLPDSTRYYLNTFEDQVHEVTYPNTRRDIYSSLATYYESNQVDGNKVAHYLQLAHTEDLRIKKSQTEKKINVINQQLKELKQKKQLEGRTYRRIFDYGLIAFLLLVSLLTTAWFNRRGLIEKYAQIKEKYIQTEKEYTQIKEEHSEIKEKYNQTSTEYKQAKKEYIQVEKKYLRTKEKYAQIKEKYTQEKEEYIQIKEEYALAKKKYTSKDAEYTTVKWEHARTKEKYEEIENKYMKASSIQFDLTLSQLYFSDAGLKSIAESINYLHEKNLAYAGSPVWEQQLMFREKFSDQLAGLAKITLERLHNGQTALLHLKPEHLPIIQLARLRHTDEEISRMLGHEGNKKKTVTLYKKQIRRIMTKAEMADKDIKDLLPEIAAD